MAFLAPLIPMAIEAVAAAGTVYAGVRMAKATSAAMRSDRSAPIPEAPTMSSASDQLDAAARNAQSAGGRTSTVLAPIDTGEQDAKRTSKVLLGT